MDDREFERLMEPLMEKIAEERIVPQNHKFSPDFEQKLLQKVMQKKNKGSVEKTVYEKTTLHEIQHQNHDARSKIADPTVSKHYAFSGLAACILIAMTLGVMLHYSDEPDLMQSTAIPLEEVQSTEQTDITTTVGTTFCSDETVTQTVTTVTTALETTTLIDDVQYETALPVDAQMTTISLETTASSETTTPLAPIYGLGDVDMDGKITFVDTVLVNLDWQLAERGLSDESFLDDEQRKLGNVDGKSLGRYWDGESYVPEWNSKLNDFNQQIEYIPYLLDFRDGLIIECVHILQMMTDEQITIQDYMSMYGQSFNKSLLLQKMKDENPEVYQKYKDAHNIVKKYDDINKLDLFSNPDDIKCQQYSLDEFWADMEILRAI